MAKRRGRGGWSYAGRERCTRKEKKNVLQRCSPQKDNRKRGGPRGGGGGTPSIRSNEKATMAFRCRSKEHGKKVEEGKRKRNLLEGGSGNKRFAGRGVEDGWEKEGSVSERGGGSLP